MTSFVARMMCHGGLRTRLDVLRGRLDGLVRRLCTHADLIERSADRSCTRADVIATCRPTIDTRWLAIQTYKRGSFTAHR